MKPRNTSTPHALKAQLRIGSAQSWCWLALGSVALAEIAAIHVPDALVLDLQHGLWERGSMEAAIGIARAHAPVLVRTADHSMLAVGTALDAGAHGVLAPMIESAEQVHALVQAGRYPPVGRRSGGGVRPLMGGLAGMRAMDERIALGAMIETVAGVEQAQAICAVPGLDFILIGTGDLSLSMAGASEAEQRKACSAVRRAAHAQGLPCGVFTADAAAARRGLRAGFDIVVAANDIGLVHQGIARSLATVRA